MLVLIVNNLMENKLNYLCQTNVLFILYLANFKKKDEKSEKS